MGWFSKVVSFAGTVIKSASDVAKSAYNKAKEYAGKAIGWLADKAEGFVSDVKTVWKTVKPYVAQIRTAIRAAAMAVPVPWIKAALLLLDEGLGALTAFEKSPIAKKVEEAIKWAIKLAKRWQAARNSAQDRPQSAEQDNSVEQPLGELTAEELVIAKKHQENLRFAEREIVSSEHRHKLSMAAVINDYEIASTDLAITIENGVSDYEHYLRLRAVQKLLNMAEKSFRTAQSMDDLSAEDLFLVRIASDLIRENPELSSQSAQRLDRVLTERYGKALQPFIFEELVASWSKRSDSLGTEWGMLNRTYAKDTILHKRLTIAKQVQGELSTEEGQLVEKLLTELPARKHALDALATKQRDIERYLGATEGFLQLLEKSPEQIETEDRSYLLDEGAAVGKLLIECAQNDTPYSELEEENRKLITDYANIFKIEAKDRAKKLLDVAA